VSAARPRAVLLDALGTLVALEPPAPALRMQLFDRFGAEVSLGAAERAVSAEIAYYRSHFDEGRDAAAVAALRHRCAAALRDALGPVAAAIELGDLTEALLASLRFVAFDDAAPALTALRAAGARLVVVSNWDWSLHEVLQRLGLAARVDGIVTSAEVGARKPAGEIFVRGLALAGVGARDAIHVGDSVSDDVEGARAAGIEAVLISRDGSPGPPGVHTVPSLLGLLLSR
jgi:putative hydrolase of the HAD superfamily